MSGGGLVSMAIFLAERGTYLVHGAFFYDPYTFSRDLHHLADGLEGVLAHLGCNKGAVHVPRLPDGEWATQIQALARWVGDPPIRAFLRKLMAWGASQELSPVNAELLFGSRHEPAPIVSAFLCDGQYVCPDRFLEAVQVDVPLCHDVLVGAEDVGLACREEAPGHGDAWPGGYLTVAEGAGAHTVRLSEGLKNTLGKFRYSQVTTLLVIRLIVTR